MKNLTIILILLLSAKITSGQAWKAGAGIQTHSQPFAGAFLELEYNASQNSSFGVISRLSLGYRNQTEKHNAFTAELTRGFRLNVGGSFYVEQNLGVGVMHSYYKDRYWHENDWHNLFATGAKGRTFDIAPSVSLGIGREFGGVDGKTNNLWVRPKVFWQLPSNNPSNPNFTLQFGYSRNLTQ